jgi:phosphatidylglycerophosphate synthase
MGIYSNKPKFQDALRVVERPLVRWRVHPDVLTLSALGLSFLGGFALFASRWTPWTLLAVSFIALLRICLNALDGMVAKDLGVARPWGEVLNELSDRLSDVAFFVGLALVQGINMPLALSVLVLMLITSYVGILSKAAGAAREFGGIMGKADRMILLAVASILALILPNLPVFNGFLTLVLVGLAATLIQRLRRTYVALKPGR